MGARAACIPVRSGQLVRRWSSTLGRSSSSAIPAAVQHHSAAGASTLGSLAAAFVRVLLLELPELPFSTSAALTPAASSCACWALASHCKPAALHAAAALMPAAAAAVAADGGGGERLPAAARSRSRCRPAATKAAMASAQVAGLTRQLRSREPGAPEDALAALAGMACDGPAACAAIAAAGGIETGVACLFSSSLRIRRFAAAMLGALVDDSSERCAALIAARAAPALVRLVHGEASQHPAVLELCSLARCGDEHALQAARRRPGAHCGDAAAQRQHVHPRGSSCLPHCPEGAGILHCPEGCCSCWREGLAADAGTQVHAATPPWANPCTCPG